MVSGGVRSAIRLAGAVLVLACSYIVVCAVAVLAPVGATASQSSGFGFGFGFGGMPSIWPFFAKRRKKGENSDSQCSASNVCPLTTLENLKYEIDEFNLTTRLKSTNDGSNDRAKHKSSSSPSLSPLSPPLPLSSTPKIEPEPVHSPPTGRRAVVRKEYPIADQTKLLNEDPLVFVWDKFMTDSECDHLIALANASLAPAEVSGDRGGERSSARTNRVHWIDHSTDAVTKRLSRRIAQLVGIPLKYAEAFQVIHYNTGEQYHYHYDAYDHGTTRGEFNMARGGQRLVTVLAYLNTVEEGGATSFWHLNLDVKPIKGRLLIFHNCIGNTTTKHPSTLHQGNPPRSGDKWAFNLWFHELPYQF